MEKTYRNQSNIMISTGCVFDKQKSRANKVLYRLNITQYYSAWLYVILCLCGNAFNKSNITDHNNINKSPEPK
ncbi:hypothetical protein Bhyg_06918 [Pseudolycoriella hygida]|uniref:Uncharacterized protein n=1 Tax=Pseudolycoriella hygida TaxID=35572 RepID=A0A9Q0N1L8_9DIPT|nr:hypothetical protein Bhyg_06918 [Pseudolycoriella hygida]